jgi:chromosomal replication initiation ATPase DnaA
MTLRKLDKKIVEELREEAAAQIDPVLKKFNLTWEDVFRQDRSPLPLAARQEIYVRIRAYLKWSYPKIGKLFNRDHATILMSVRKYKKLRQKPK